MSDGAPVAEALHSEFDEDLDFSNGKTCRSLELVQKSLLPE